MAPKNNPYFGARTKSPAPALNALQISRQPIDLISGTRGGTMFFPVCCSAIFSAPNPLSPVEITNPEKSNG
jgi:hypothetical protein